MKQVLTLLIFLIASSVLAQEDWKLRKEEDGITAYTKKRPGIKFNEYLVTATIDAELSQVMAIFKDFDSYTSIFPGTEDAKGYHDEPLHHVTYIKFNIPFPARDRDAVFINHLSYNKDERILAIDVKCDPDQYETNEKLIRITFCEGGWEFKDIGNGQISIRHNLIVDPAGMAPAFIVNSKTVDDPIKTIKSLREKIGHQKYKGHEYAVLEE